MKTVQINVLKLAKSILFSIGKLTYDSKLHFDYASLVELLYCKLELMPPFDFCNPFILRIALFAGGTIALLENHDKGVVHVQLNQMRPAFSPFETNNVYLIVFMG